MNERAHRPQAGLQSLTAGVPAQEAPAHARRLLEEAWSLHTECLLMRDGLLEACQEIERAMAGLEQRLEALPPGR